LATNQSRLDALINSERVEALSGLSALAPERRMSAVG
jgi:hypothetical protein